MAYQIGSDASVTQITREVLDRKKFLFGYTDEICQEKKYIGVALHTTDEKFYTHPTLFRSLNFSPHKWVRVGLTENGLLHMEECHPCTEALYSGGVSTTVAL